MQYQKISIVTPSYNQAAFLERTILSVVNQKYPNLEYIIIDGGSTDGSVDIIKKYEKHITYWVSEKDSGQSEAINKGFNKATGEIFAYLNSDDIYFSNTVQLISELFEKNKKIDLLYGHAQLLDSDDHDIGLCVALPFKLNEHLNGVFSIPQQSAFWKRNVYEKVGGFNINNHTCMDAEFFAFAATNNFSFKMINKILAGFRIHPSSKTGNEKSELKLSYRGDQEKFINIIASKKNIHINKFLQTLYRWKYIPYKMYVMSTARV
jgi:glycosyltransferase involved in cell wall biosynthesis